MSFSEFTQKDYDVIAREYADLKEAARKRCTNEQELAVVQKAFDFANEAHTNVRRRSGEPYILHPIAVAKIVITDIGLGYKSIAAALLHDVVEDTDYTVDDIRKLFGDKIASLVDGLTKIKTVLDNQDKNTPDEEYNQSLQAENFKRILLTLNDDVRVVLIKCADRLHNCRTIEFMPEYKRDKILSETMFVFIPLAHRLGLYEVKSEMENIWLRYKEPEAYNEIQAKINRNLTDKKKEIDDFIKPIEEALTNNGFTFQIRKRLKTPYSIWHKMMTKNVTFEQIYDLYAIRIIFDFKPKKETDTERDECYHIFSIITGIYRYKSDRVRDWVKHPKSNGYEALHCTLLSNSGIWVEVEIRTRRRDEIAEKGIASHWAYKQDGYASENDSEMDKWLTKVKDILTNPDVNALELLDLLHSDMTSSDIVIFTPKGEQKTIQKGATALDFAYMIHSHIGHKAIAAKVNMKLVPLSYVLKTGDQVEIITAEDEHPKREWLQFLQTIQAKSFVMSYFRSDKAAIIEEGRIALNARFKESGYKVTDRYMAHLAQALQLRSFDELYFRFALGLVSYESIEAASLTLNIPGKTRWYDITNLFHKKDDAPAKPNKKEEYVIGSPEDKHKYIISKCCNPIPGDSIIGFVNADGSITVHKKTCPEANSLASKHGDRIVIPRWADREDMYFLARLSLKGTDRVGLLNEITRYISLAMNVNIKRLNLGTEQDIFSGYIDLYVPDKKILDALIGKLRSINGLQEVMRTEI